MQFSSSLPHNYATDCAQAYSIKWINVLLVNVIFEDAKVSEFIYKCLGERTTIKRFVY